MLIVCVARTELLDDRPSWGGGNPRATAIELGAADAPTRAPSSPTRCSPAPTCRRAQRALVLERAEGNPLFLEETARMLARGDGDGVASGSPTRVQALIAARIDLLPAPRSACCSTRRVIGRVFWRGALEQLAPELDVATAARRCATVSSSSARSSARRSRATGRSSSRTG